MHITQQTRSRPLQNGALTEDHLRKRNKSRARHGKSGRRITNKPSFNTLTFHNVTIPSRAISIKKNTIEESRLLYDAAKSLPQYKEKNWTPSNILAEFNLHNLKQLSDYYQSPVYLNSETNEILTLFASDTCSSHGAIVDIEIIKRLARKNRTLYYHTLRFIRMCTEHLEISNFLTDEHEFVIDMTMEDEETEDKEIAHELRSIYERYLPKLYRKMKDLPGNISEDYLALLKYNPRVKEYKKAKEWFLKGYQYAFNDFRISDYVPDQDAFMLINTDADNHCLHPYYYIRFIWSYSDMVGEYISNDFNEYMGNCHVLPLCVEKNIKDITDPKNTIAKIQIINEFYAWFSTGEAFELFVQHFKKQRHASNKNH